MNGNQNETPNSSAGCADTGPVNAFRGAGSTRLPHDAVPPPASREPAPQQTSGERLQTTIAAGAPKPSGSPLYDLTQARNAPMRAGVEASVADFAAAQASTSSADANHRKAHVSVFPFASLPFTAAGKFTVSAAEMIELLSKRTDNEIDAIVRQADSAELQGFQLSFYARCWVGGCCWERRRRNSEMKKKHFKTISLETWCQSVGLRSPKSAKRWADNFETVLDTPTALKCFVAFAGIDLFLPRVAEALRVLNAQLAGREPSTAELPILLAWLRERIKKKEPPVPNAQKQSTVRAEPIPINEDPYADEGFVEGAESEEELRLYLTVAIKHLALYEPLLRTYVALPADPTVEARAQKLFAFTPAPERELFGQVWSELCRRAAEREARFQSEHKMYAGEGEPQTHLNTDSATPGSTTLPALP